MRSPILDVATVGASGSSYSSPVSLVKTRALQVWGKATFNGSATSGATVKVFTSPNGSSWDTQPYATFNLTLSAGNAVQESAYIVLGEHGYVKFAITNDDSAQTLTDLKIWYSIQSWGDEGFQRHGSTLEDEREESL